LVPQHGVGLGHPLVDREQPLAQGGIPQVEGAIRMEDPRLAVVGRLDLPLGCVRSHLEDLEIVELIEDRGDGLHLDREGRVHGACYPAALSFTVAPRIFSAAAATSSSDSPEDRWIDVAACCPVSTSLAVTSTRPLVSIAKVTSIST